jgi:hypothetical protein
MDTVPNHLIMVTVTRFWTHYLVCLSSRRRQRKSKFCAVPEKCFGYIRTYVLPTAVDLIQKINLYYVK